MDELTAALITRVRAARQGVQDAVAHHDPRKVSAAVDELEEALRAAHEHGIEVAPAGAEDAGEQERA